MNKNQIIIDELKNRNIPSEVKGIVFPIIEKNISRIQFVKNFVGLKDILYFEELNVNFFDYPFFLSLNHQNTPMAIANKYENMTAVYENAITDIKEIERKLLFFFEKTNKTLYIEVAFAENMLNNDDMWRVYNSMGENTEKEPYELMIRMYKYPEWYNVNYGENIALLDESISALRYIEKSFILDSLNSLEKKMNVALDKDDFKTLKGLAKDFKVLKSQLT